MSARMEERVERGRLAKRQIPLLRPRADREVSESERNSREPHCREKLLTRRRVPVPQTDTGRRGENPKVRGKTLVKELGKMHP